MLRIYKYYYNTGDWNGWTNYYVVANSIEEVENLDHYKELQKRCEQARWDFGKASEVDSNTIFNALCMFKERDKYEISYTIKEKIAEKNYD